MKKTSVLVRLNEDLYDALHRIVDRPEHSQSMNSFLAAAVAEAVAAYEPGVAMRALAAKAGYSSTGETSGTIKPWPRCGKATTAALLRARASKPTGKAKRTGSWWRIVDTTVLVAAHAPDAPDHALWHAALYNPATPVFVPAAALDELHGALRAAATTRAPIPAGRLVEQLAGNVRCGRPLVAADHWTDDIDFAAKLSPAAQAVLSAARLAVYRLGVDTADMAVMTTDAQLAAAAVKEGFGVASGDDVFVGADA